MKKNLIIFGVNDMAEIAHYYFSNDSKYEVVAFTVDKNYIEQSSFRDLPIISFEELELYYPPQNCELFIALGYTKLNLVRKEKYLAGKAKGYKLASFVSSNATVLNDGNIGENCFIFEDNTIQTYVKIGNNVILWSGNHIGHHTVIKDHTFIASHAVISGRVEIGEQCFIGVNATLRDNITIGDRCVIGAGSLLLTSADPDGVYLGRATERSTVPSNRLKGI